MNSKTVAILHVIGFLLTVAAYFFIATRKGSKAVKIGEIVALYSTTVFFAFSRTISTVMFLITAGAIVLFNLKKAKDERRTKGFGG